MTNELLRKFENIPCRYEPGCKRGSSCWYLHKERDKTNKEIIHDSTTNKNEIGNLKVKQSQFEEKS